MSASEKAIALAAAESAAASAVTAAEAAEEAVAIIAAGGGGGASTWDAVAGKPSVFPSAWDQIAEKPTTFAPSDMGVFSHLNNPESFSSIAVDAISTTAATNAIAAELDTGGDIAAAIDTALQAPVFVDWSTKTASTQPTTTDSGHTVQYDRNSVTAAALTIASSTLTNTAAAAGAAAGYATITDLTDTVTRVGGEFKLTGGDNYGGSAVLIVWQQQPGSAGSFPTNVPDSPLHLELHADRAVLSVFQGGAISAIKTWTYATPLTKGTTYRAEAYLIGSTAYLYLPDDTFQTVTDARIASEVGAFPCWEVYQADAATDAKAGWVNGWVDTRADYRSPFATIAALQRGVRPVSVSNVESGTDAYARAGVRNTASHTGAAALGGTDNSALHPYSVVSGNQARTRAQGDRAHAAGYFAAQGDAQAHDYVTRCTTTNATPTKLGTTGATTVAGGIPVGATSTFACSALVSARRTDVVGECAAYRIDFAVRRAGGSLSILGTPVTTVLGEDDATWNATVVVDSTNAVFHIEATGAAAKTIRWVAAIRAAEVA